VARNEIRMNRFRNYPRSMLKKLVFGTLARFSADQNGRIAVRTLSGPAKGLRFRLDLLGNYEMGYFLGNYERNIVDRLSTFVQPGWVIWDVGVYVGYYTCLLARLVGAVGKVVAVEADPRNLARTQQHIAMNGFTNVSCICAAIGVPHTEMDLFVGEGSNSHLSGTWIGATRENYAAKEMRDTAIKVTCKSLDQLLLDGLAPRPDLIKLDIDGAELWAFQHMDTLATTVRPIFLIELHNPQCDEAAWRFASRCNYGIADFDTGEVFTRAESVHGTILLTPRN
jgi:FkbM family methyltransferase